VVKRLSSRRGMRPAIDNCVYVHNIHACQVVGFDWDAGNARKSLDKHSVGQTEAEQAFFNAPLIVIADAFHSATQTRYHALGKTDEQRRLQITFTLRQGGTLVRVISARDMSGKERIVYGQSP
jgi:uncharacterized DUF497 family protein